MFRCIKQIDSYEDKQIDSYKWVGVIKSSVTQPKTKCEKRQTWCIVCGCVLPHNEPSPIRDDSTKMTKRLFLRSTFLMCVCVCVLWRYFFSRFSFPGCWKVWKCSWNFWGCFSIRIPHSGTHSLSSQWTGAVSFEQFSSIKMTMWKVWTSLFY